MEEKKYFTDDFGDKYRYVLCYLWYGDDYEKYANDIETLDKYAKEMLEKNSGKPLIIVNGNDEVVKEYTKRLRYTDR